MAAGRLILVADSDAEIVRRIQSQARSEGYNVIAATTGRDVIPMAIASRPALIVLDVVFPDVDGRDLLKELRRDPRIADIPVLMLSKRDYESDRSIALELGAADYLAKDASALLMSRIARLLNTTGVR